MAVKYHPSVGDIVMCEFPPCFAPPEMVKMRPVVVISPKIPGRLNMVAVVPLSTTCPAPVLAHHCTIPIKLMPKTFQATNEDCWAKCDMVYTFCLSRLSLVKGRRDPKTKVRTYEKARLDLATIQAVRRCLGSSLGIGPELWEKPETAQEDTPALTLVQASPPAAA